MNALREGMPALPDRMRRLAIDARGYPVPWFVQWFDGKPDFRVIDTPKLGTAHNQKLCWICGTPRGVHLAFAIGPMCVVNRTTSEPPAHYECAHFAVRACPFMILPKAQRREANLPEERYQAEGHITPNPGASAIYVTRTYKPFRHGRDVLFELGEPQRVEWYCEGREATRAEIQHSIDTGLPLLRAQAYGDDGHALLDQLTAQAQRWLPAG